jgi:hypothetical protein
VSSCRAVSDWIGRGGVRRGLFEGTIQELPGGTKTPGRTAVIRNKDSNHEPSKYEEGIMITRPQSSVNPGRTFKFKK